MKSFLDTYFAAVKRFIPESEPKAMVGLDIGVTSCKMVELKKKGGGYELVRSAVANLEGGDQKKAIRECLAQCTLPNTVPVTSVVGKGTLIRFIEMPRMGLDDLRRSFQFEADKYFPFPKEDIYMDCHILDPNSKDSKMSVLIAASKKEIVNDRIKLLTEMGLQSDQVTLNAVAIANIVNILGVVPAKQDGKDKGPVAVAVLDVGEVLSNLTISLDGRPCLMRDLFVGGREITKSISNTLGVSMEEAEKLKQNPGAKAEDVTQACESALADLVSELRMSFDYFVTEKNTSISKVLLTGGGSTFEGLRTVLANYLEIPVEKWNAFAPVEMGAEVDKSDVLAQAQKMTVALGLALSS